MFDYNIVLLDLPCTVKGLTAKDENDYYTIYINAKLCDEQQIDAFLHEIEHIKCNDFCNDSDIAIIENGCRERRMV